MFDHLMLSISYYASSTLLEGDIIQRSQGFFGFPTKF